jgi:thioredoxin-related protein
MYKITFCLVLIIGFLFETKSQDTQSLKLIIFEGSDWCASCRKFEKQILRDSTVIDFLKEKHIELVKVDFPQRKKLSLEKENENKLIAEKYNFKGVFPTIVFDNSENAYILYNNNITPEKFIDWLDVKISKNEDD